jgi:UDP-N-acetylmuramate dehydrogenase
MLLTNTHKKWLLDRFGEDVRFTEPMSQHTSLRIGGPADAYIAPDHPGDLASLCQWCQQNHIPSLIIGNGTNLLVKDGGIGGIVISLKHCYKDLQHTLIQPGVAQISAGAAVPLSALCKYAIRHGIKGLNFAVGIPGTLGGAIMMNAGTALGCMGDVLNHVSVLTADGDIRQYPKKALMFGYRRMTWNPDFQDVSTSFPLILEGTLQLGLADAAELKTEADAILKTRANSQPLHQRSAGSFFKNPASGPTAGELIDQAGLKGTQVGGAQISKSHANWIVNLGQATAADVIKLKDLIQTTVANQYQIDLEPEVQIVGT